MLKNKKLRVPHLTGEILITGGLGFIGSNLAQRLVENGAQVTLFSRSLDNLRNVVEIKDKVKIVIGDIRDYETVRRLVKNKDYIFHFAGQIDHIFSMENPQLDADINCKGTLNVLESCRRFNDEANIVFSSSVGVIGIVKNIPANENEKELPLSIYESHKLVCEKYLSVYYKNYGLPTTTLRFANVFGERQKMTVSPRGILNQMIRRAFLGEAITIYGKGNFIRDYCYIQNYLDACLLSVDSHKTKGEIYIIGSGKGITFKEMVEKVNSVVKELIGKSTQIKYVPFPAHYKKLDRGDFIADYSKFNKATGWYPYISFEEGLKRTVLFYKERLKDYIH